MFQRHPVPLLVQVRLRAYYPLAMIFVALLIGWVILATFWPRTVFYYFAVAGGVLSAVTLGLAFHSRIQRRFKKRQAEDEARVRALQETLDNASRSSQRGEEVPRR